MAIRHFLKLADFTKDELNTMLRRAAEIKALQKELQTTKAENN